jgi:hypothetical protein
MPRAGVGERVWSGEPLFDRHLSLLSARLGVERSCPPSSYPPLASYISIISTTVDGALAAAETEAARDCLF